MEIERFMNSNQLLNLLIKNIILKTYNSAKNEMSSIIFKIDVSSKKNNRLLENFRNKVKQREYFLHSRYSSYLTSFQAREFRPSQ